MFLEEERVYELIHLDAIDHNIEQIEQNVSRESKVIAVLKTDGYGQGAVPIMTRLERRERVWGYALATPEEAYALYEAGAKKPMIVLGASFAGNFKKMIEYGVRPAVFDYDTACAINEAAVAINKVCKIHIKLDTGMGRIGIRADESAAELIERISALENIEIEGMFTHFARADEADKEPAKRQFERFIAVRDKLIDMGISIPVVHCSNSAGIIDLKEYNMNAVRAGIILYGLYPSDEVEKDRIDLKPIMELKSTLTFVKDVLPGDEISYGGTFKADKKMRVGTVPVGYGDGYPRSLSNKGYVLVDGKRANILGRVCMDQFMVDVSDIPGAKRGSHVTLIGRDGNSEITVDELAGLSGRFNYEFVCCISKRVPRIPVD